MKEGRASAGHRSNMALEPIGGQASRTGNSVETGWTAKTWPLIPWPIGTNTTMLKNREEI